MAGVGGNGEWSGRGQRGALWARQQCAVGGTGESEMRGSGDIDGERLS